MENLKQCPYNPYHQIRASRFLKHVFKCAKNHPHINLQQCPFNASHFVKVEDFEQHKSNCSDKWKFEKYLLEPDNLMFKENIVVRVPKIEMSECWDDLQAKSYDPQKHCETYPVIRSCIGKSKKERQEFYAKENEHEYLKKKVMKIFIAFLVSAIGLVVAQEFPLLTSNFFGNGNPGIFPTLLNDGSSYYHDSSDESSYDDHKYISGTPFTSYFNLSNCGTSGSWGQQPNFNSFGLENLFSSLFPGFNSFGQVSNNAVSQPSQNWNFGNGFYPPFLMGIPNNSMSNLGFNPYSTYGMGNFAMNPLAIQNQGTYNPYATYGFGNFAINPTRFQYQTIVNPYSTYGLGNFAMNPLAFQNQAMSNPYANYGLGNFALNPMRFQNQGRGHGRGNGRGRGNGNGNMAPNYDYYGFGTYNFGQPSYSSYNGGSMQSQGSNSMPLSSMSLPYMFG
uniref:CSON009894 protein n=1 Tax=Culicoides sonorensis TaxID=179676 RepID=A0A336M3T2_CULSO